jgi:hypothetical protein
MTVYFHVYITPFLLPGLHWNWRRFNTVPFSIGDLKRGKWTETRNVMDFELNEILDKIYNNNLKI